MGRWEWDGVGGKRRLTEGLVEVSRELGRVCFYLTSSLWIQEDGKSPLL